MEFIKLQRKVLRFSEAIKSCAECDTMSPWQVICSRWANHASVPPRCPEIDLMMAACQPLSYQNWFLDQISRGGLVRGGQSMIMTQSEMVITPDISPAASQGWLSPIHRLHPNLELWIKQKLNWFIWKFFWMLKLDLSPSLELLMPSQFHQISKYPNI